MEASRVGRLDGNIDDGDHSFAASLMERDSSREFQETNDILLKDIRDTNKFVPGTAMLDSWMVKKYAKEVRCIVFPAGRERGDHLE